MWGVWFPSLGPGLNKKEGASRVYSLLSVPQGTQCDQLPASAAGAPLSWWTVTWDGELN